MNKFPTKTFLAITVCLLILIGVKATSGHDKGLDLRVLLSVFEFRSLSASVSGNDSAAATTPVPTQGATSRLLDDSAGSLDRLYESLRDTEKKTPGAITRIVHYGDSPTTADMITGDVRQLLQDRFGDAGKGFTLLAKPWAWYQHRDVELSSSGFHIVPAIGFGKRDGLFGLGGVSFEGNAGSYSRIKTRNDDHTKVEIEYLPDSSGGTVTVAANGTNVGSFQTTSQSGEAGFAAFDLPAQTDSVEIRTSNGNVRLFGAILDKPGPGVSYDSLGLNGASITVLARVFNEQYWAKELRHRRPNLVVLNYGTNESEFASYISTQYEKELREAIRRVRTAVPEASVLVMSPMDRGQRVAGGAVRTLPTIPQIVEIQRRIAKETGCAFFDTFHAMGGEGTMARWYEVRPRLVTADLMHPLPQGANLVANAFAKELLAGFERYKMRQLQHVKMAKGK